MIPFLGIAKLFSNPLTKYLGEKAIGYFEHKSEMLKNERIAEIELSKSVQIQQIKSSEKSWKDEYLTIVFTCILVALWAFNYSRRTLPRRPRIFKK
jgi:hypothetical protein